MRKMISSVNYYSVLFALGLAFTLVPSDSDAQDILNPPGDVDIRYDFTISEVAGIRFIDVSRTVVNDEPFNLKSLYFSDKLPSDLVVDDFAVRIDNIPIDVYYTGPVPSQFDLGYNMHRWVIDFPEDDDIFNNLVGPGRILILQYRIVAENRGQIVLPFHTVCYYGLNNGFFTTADTIFIPPLSAEIPTLGQWGLILLFLLILTVTTITSICSRYRLRTEICEADGNKQNSISPE